MDSSTFCVLFLLVFFFSDGGESQFICSKSFCQGDESISPPVRFPFRLRIKQDPQCGFQPDFDLSCNNRNQTILKLPVAGDFVVERIDYVKQALWINHNDPDRCLPRRLLEVHLDLQSSPFQFADGSGNFTFINCSYRVDSLPFYGFQKIKCMSGGNFSIVSVPTKDYPSASALLPAPCRVIATARQPLRAAVEEGMALRWSFPDCGDCEARGGDCGLRSNSSAEVQCFNLPKSGLPRAAKYGLIIGVGIPGLLFLSGLSCYICGKFKACTRPNNATSNSFSLGHQPTIMMAGLNGPTIQSFPKTVLGESRRLPKPNDNVCSICLSEYEAKETIRTIPECSHYFHANCVDEWLKLNGTCPVCRNSPEESSVATTPSSVSRSSTTLSSLP